MKSTSFVLICLLASACDRRGDVREVEQLEAQRIRYAQAIEEDFPNSLFSPQVDEVLDSLKTISGSKDLVAEAKGLVERILAYGLSRDLDFHDEELVNELVDHFEASGYSVPQLIGKIVSSEKFSKRK